MRKNIRRFALLLAPFAILTASLVAGSFAYAAAIGRCEELFESKSDSVLVAKSDRIEMSDADHLVLIDVFDTIITQMEAWPKRAFEKLKDDSQVAAVRNIRKIVDLANRVRSPGALSEVNRSQIELRDRLYEFTRVHLSTTYRALNAADIHGLKREIVLVDQKDLANKEIGRLDFEKAGLPSPASDAAMLKSVEGVLTNLESGMERKADGHLTDVNQVRAARAINHIVTSARDVYSRRGDTQRRALTQQLKARLEALAIRSFGYIYTRTFNLDLHYPMPTSIEVNQLDAVWKMIDRLDQP